MHMYLYENELEILLTGAPISPYRGSESMSGEEIERPQQTFSDELREEYFTNFSVAVTPHEIMIFFGKLS